MDLWGGQGMVHVDTAAIRALAGRFEAGADVVMQLGTRFSAGAGLSPDAFGSLPAGQQASAGYAQRFQHASESLGQLGSCLRQFAGNLRTVAGNWERADDTSQAR
jgi:uncharacterized protein YukE